MGPGTYRPSYNQQNAYIQAPVLGRSNSERFGLTQSEKDLQDVGPGKYTVLSKLVPAFQNKPTVSFTSRAPKDQFFAELNRKVFAKRSKSQQTLRVRKGPIGAVNEVLDFDEDTDYRRIKPDFINGTNVGPGTYNTTKYTGVNSDRAQGKNKTFNVTAPRFFKSGNSTNINVGPPSYDSTRGNFLFKKAKTTYNKLIDRIPFETKQKRLKYEDKRVPGAGAYETKPTFIENLNSKNAIHKIDTEYLKKASDPRFIVPQDVYENADIGPGHYEDMHENLRIVENKPLVSFASLNPRLPPYPHMDKLYGTYKTDQETITVKAINEKFNKYSFNSGTDRFDSRNLKANILYNKQDETELKDLIDGNTDVKNNMRTEKKMTFSSSYGGGFKGGLIDEKDADRIKHAKVKSGFGMADQRFHTNLKMAHIGPGKYYKDKNFEIGTFNIRYT